MGFASSNGSPQRAKEVSHGLKPRLKTSSPQNQMKHDFKVKKEGLDQSHRKVTSDMVAETELKVIDIDDHGLSEDSDHVLLSSGSLSSSPLSSDDSPQVMEFDSFRLSLQHQFSSISLSTGSSDVSLGRGNEALFFDGSKTSPKINTSLSGEMTCDENNIEDLKPCLVGKKGKGSSVADSESSNSNEIEDRPTTNISSALHTRSVDIPSRNFDRTDIWVSSLDLEEEDSELIQVREKAFDIFDSDFPSPSFKSAVKHLPVLSSSLNSSASVGQEVELNNTAADPDSDEPLLWPFDDSLYSCLDFEKFLCPSPCKIERSAVSTGFPGSKSTVLKHRNNSSQANRKETGVLGRRAATAKGVTKHLNNGAQNMASTLSSRFSRSTEAPSQHQCCISKRRGKPRLKIDVHKHGCRSTVTKFSSHGTSIA